MSNYHRSPQNLSSLAALVLSRARRLAPSADLVVAPVLHGPALARVVAAPARAEQVALPAAEVRATASRTSTVVGLSLGDPSA